MPIAMVRHRGYRCDDCHYFLNQLCRSHGAKEFWRMHTHGYVDNFGKVEVYPVPADDTKPLGSLAEMCPYHEKVTNR